MLAVDSDDFALRGFLSIPRTTDALPAIGAVAPTTRTLSPTRTVMLRMPKSRVRCAQLKPCTDAPASWDGAFACDLRCLFGFMLLTMVSPHTICRRRGDIGYRSAFLERRAP